MNKNIRLFLACFLVVMASIFITSFISHDSFAHTASMTTDSSITLDIVPANGGIAIDEASVNVVTTCRNGYNLTLATPNGSNLYLNGDGTGTAAFTAVNGTSTLANSTNKWGYTLTANASSSTVFYPLSASKTTLKTTSQTASASDINDTFSIYYGVKADSSVAPGSYKMANDGPLVYYLTMEPSCNAVNITYDGNNADAGTMAAVHSNKKEGDTFTLIASNFSRSGYGFAGWSVDPNAGAKLADNDSTNNPIIYGPQETVTLPVGFLDNDTDNDGEIKLYAVWIPAEKDGSNNPIYLQGWMGCGNLDTTTYDSTTGALDLTKNSITALTDQRDNETYAIARLADGECWMIENLRLEADATTGNNQNDSSVTNEWLSQGYRISAAFGSFSGLADAEELTFGGSDANSLYYSGVQSGTAIIDINTVNYPFRRMPRYNNTNTQSRAINPTSDEGPTYSYGNYYTWSAAIADTTYHATNNENVDSTSICPAGWRLPRGGQTTVNQTAEFYLLGLAIMNQEPNWNTGNGYGAYNEDVTNIAGDVAHKAFRKYPNNFLRSYSYNYSGIDMQVRQGKYWSSTSADLDDASSYCMHIDGEYVSPATFGCSRSYGNSIRCVTSTSAEQTLSYDANGGSNAPTAIQTTTANGIASFVVSNTTPTRSGYTFAGWTDEKGNEVQPGDTFTTKDVNAVLYAIWTNNSCNPTATTIGTGNISTDAVCLQDVKPSMKASLPLADSATGTYSLIDARDGQSYTIAKLAGGELWLTKNLNYGNNNEVLLTRHDTDLPPGTTFKAPATTTDFEATNTDAAYVNPKILTDSTYGGYYSFAAAIASTLEYNKSSQIITTSICPKGWDLPNYDQYNTLMSKSGNYNYAAMNATPYSFIYAGYRDGTDFISQTSAIRLWTSTNVLSNVAYYTVAYSSPLYGSNYKRYGESVRCIASNGTVTVNYDANGGSGIMMSQTGDINALAVKSNSFTAPTNGRFRNWNTSADGTGTTVTAGDPLSDIASDGDTITLYAQWDELYYIAFNANESSVDSSITATGTMTNQSVARDVATVIKTNTFALAGYIFYGWNTSADGTGTLYGDARSVTNLTSTGNTITLYAIWVKEALLDTGGSVNVKLKKLAGNSSASSLTIDNSITAIVRSSTLPNDFTPSDDNTISHSSSPFPIYAWYDSGSTTIYYYSEATMILMNKDSSSFFRNMRALSNLSTISTWNTIKVTSMTYLFNYVGYNASTFALDLSTWDTSGVTTTYNMFGYTGYSATTWSITIPRTNDGTASGPIANTTSTLYGQTTSVTATLDSGRSFTLAN